METKIVLQRHTKLGRISAGARSALIARAEFGPVVTSRVNNNITLGVVHNCQHLCIRTERTEGGGGHDASVLFLNVDFFILMLPPGGYYRENAAPRDGLLRNCCYLQDSILVTR